MSRLGLGKGVPTLPLSVSTVFQIIVMSSRGILGSFKETIPSPLNYLVSPTYNYTSSQKLFGETPLEKWLSDSIMRTGNRVLKLISSISLCPSDSNVSTNMVEEYTGTSVVHGEDVKSKRIGNLPKCTLY